MKLIRDALAADAHIHDALESKKRIIAPTSLHPFLASIRAADRPLLIVTSSSRSSEDLVNDLKELHDDVFEFPAWETLPHERLSPRSDTVAQRISTLIKLKENKAHNPIVVTPVRGLIHRIINSLAQTPVRELAVGAQCDLKELINHLGELAYQRTDLVERRGEFAVRGGIVDVFLPLANQPVRIDFFGDEIEDISYFDVAGQRTTRVANESIKILPCRELLLTPAVQAKARALIMDFPQASEILEKLSEGITSEGMESFIPLLVDSTESILDRMPTNTEVIFIDEERIKSRASDLLATNEEFYLASWLNAASGGATPLHSGSGTYMQWDELNAEIDKNGLQQRSFNVFGSDLDKEAVFLEAQAIDPLRGNTERLVDEFRSAAEAGQSLVFAAHGHGMHERYSNLFRSAEISVRVVTSTIAFGFSVPSARILFISERDLSGSKGAINNTEKLPSKRKTAIDPLELKAGDFVVHEQHGIGRYIELVSRTVAGVTREYLVLEYASAKRGQPGDRIFVPTDSLEQVSKYVGGETPTVHRIGSGEWQKAKGRARKAVRQIAGELIRLYAARTSSPGFAFSPDTPWQRELEDSFAYIETPDQLSTINEVKADMERPYPMDRIVCGDVGYGKTEIAIRAAFKAVQDGKQVAVLVPTTLLVQQHTKTFIERYSGFPIQVAGLSRFNTAKESKEILAAMEAGTLDVVVGTHRILSNDVHFKDLGLVVVDEEQRFGVEQKESLKKLRTTVDVLAMSATPIPRTLEMAVTGIREMSTITTPPEERHPILTYVGARDDAQITAAIHRELLRDGQIFYIHNRVESIDQAAQKLQTLVPEARIRIAHGQMSEGALEDVILAFWNRDFDLLVCTTIVESGLDIANANTLIVERADLFGLSQLHQLRGRVGRGRERAYAYFLFPPDQPLSELAHDRLKTIAANTELGAGMRVALKDLEIRGAGNLLGGEQSGHIADVGFDLYMRMVGEAVHEYKSGIIETSEPNHECKVELPINAHLDAAYVTGERLRLDLYRRLADVRNREDVDAIEEELKDRFGALPQEAQTLLGVAALRAFAKSISLREVVAQGKFVRLSPINLPESKQITLARMYPGSLYKSASSTVLVALPKSSAWNPSESTAPIVDTSLLAWVTQVVTELAPTSKGSS
jgi:transcription-repair coupling factor (superfamily II helicase)